MILIILIIIIILLLLLLCVFRYLFKGSNGCYHKVEGVNDEDLIIDNKSNSIILTLIENNSITERFTNCDWVFKDSFHKAFQKAGSIMGYKVINYHEFNGHYKQMNIYELLEEIHADKPNHKLIITLEANENFRDYHTFPNVIKVSG